MLLLDMHGKTNKTQIDKAHGFTYAHNGDRTLLSLILIEATAEACAAGLQCPYKSLEFPWMFAVERVLGNICITHTSTVPQKDGLFRAGQINQW